MNSIRKDMSDISQHAYAYLELAIARSINRLLYMPEMSFEHMLFARIRMGLYGIISPVSLYGIRWTYIKKQFGCLIFVSVKIKLEN
jgi:hypothetical protein